MIIAWSDDESEFDTSDSEYFNTASETVSEVSADADEEKPKTNGKTHDGSGDDEDSDDEDDDEDDEEGQTCPHQFFSKKVPKLGGRWATYTGGHISPHKKFWAKHFDLLHRN